MQTSDYSIVATSERSRESAAFWRTRLAEPDALMDALGPVRAPSAPAAGRRSIQVTQDAAGRAALTKLASDPAGRFTVLTAGVALAVCRYFNRDRVLLLTPPLSGEETPLNDGHSVPLVFDAPGALSLRDFVETAARTIEDGYAHQDFPIDTLCRQERGVDLTAAAPFSVSSRALHDDRAPRHARVHFQLDDLEAGGIGIDFDPLDVEASLVDGLALVLSATLSAFADLSAPVGRIDRLPAAQRDAMAAEWRHSVAPPYRGVVTLFEDRVRAEPEAVAVAFGAETLTFAELNARANRLARHLMATQSRAERPVVAIWMDRSPWMAIAVLGVLKAGLAYVPIDADCPAERAAFLMRDSGAAAALIDQAKAPIATACATVLADREMPGSADNPCLDIAAGDLAYLIYTSGSTGLPKGCEVEHGNLSNYLQWAIDYYWPPDRTGSMALFTPLSFDLTVPSLFCPLLRGRTLTIFRQDLGVDEMLRRQFEPGSGIDSVKLTPSHIHVLESARLSSTDVSLAIVGGEAMTDRHVAALHRLSPHMRVVNEYGPTEATVGCIVKDIAPGEPITIGRPIAGMRAYVLDREQQLVAAGVRGEIVVAGASVARGYHARPNLPAASFLPDPFVPGSRMYRTGDVGRRRPDGDLECFGRLDAQLKVRGYRVEPGEIETALRSAGATDAVVVERDGQLLAYVAPATVDPHALQAALARSLPQYMVPDMIVAIDALPLTANGKVDRARLPAPGTARPERRHDPQGPHEEVLAGIWAEVFRRPRVGVEEDFFALGGHSLLAMTVMQRIHQRLGVDVSIGDILEGRTIAALAATVASRRPSSEPSIVPLPSADHYAVSHGQRRLWIINRIEEDSPAYNVSSAFELRGALDAGALQQAFDALVARHESLRTVFDSVDDEPRQRVMPAQHVSIEVVDLPHDPGAMAAAARRRVADPFDLRKGPLLRVTLFRHDAARATLLLTLHHIVSDAWSMRVLIGDLVRLYETYQAGRGVMPAPLSVHYKEYAAWQRALLASDAMRAHRDYWVAKLTGTPPVALPADMARPAAPAARGRHHYAQLDADLAASLRALGARHGASLFMTLTALVKVLLHRHTGQTDIAVGSPIAGRTRAELAPQIGFYVNTIVLRDDVRGTDAFADLLARVARTAANAFEHQAFPFDRLVEELDLARDLSRAPLFDVMVTYEADVEAPPVTAGLTVTDVRIESGISKFDLTFSFASSPDGIALELEYRDDLFLPSRIETLTSHLIAVARAAAADPAAAVASYDLGSPVPAGVTSPGHGAADSSAGVDPERPVAPRDAREIALVSALESVLGRDGLSVTANFFFAGGDSIKAIQAVSRLARDGWHLRVRDVFEAPRIELLARRMDRTAAPASRAAADGDVPLTPIQRWFLRTQPEARHHYNQSVMLRFDERLDEDAVRAIGRALVLHHDALRLRFLVTGDDARQFHGPAYDPVELHDLRASADPAADLEQRASQVQAGLDIENGPLARFALFRLPDGDRLLAAIHHLAVDGVSWRILLDDLRTGLAQSARGEAISFGERSDSYQAWARALAATAADAALEQAWWEAIERTPVLALPRDREAGELFEHAAVEHVFSLDAQDTADLLSRVHQAYNTRTSDVLLASLARALHEWAGAGAALLDVEAHGRDAVAGVDVSRTVGWFTTMYPIVLDLGAPGGLGELLKDIKESLRRTPGHGLGYGLLRDGRQSGAEIQFNFLGQFDTDIEGFEIAREARGAESGPRARMTHAIVISGLIAEGRLHLTVRYAPARYEPSTIARLAQAWQRSLEDVIAHCRARVTGERTLSDFRYHDTATSSLVARLGVDRVEDVYPLSPLQAGMLYHTELAAGSPVYVEQFTCEIGGALDAGLFRQSWDAVIQRHTALRTAFAWQGVEQPVQVVFSRVDAPWETLDWRTLPDSQQAARLEAFARDDRARPIDLAAAPVMRFTLIRLAGERWRFFWTSHHAVLDGWSTAIVLQDVFAVYHAAVTGVDFQAPMPRPYGDYIDWLRAQDAGAGAAYWHARLADFTTPTPLPGAASAPVDGAPFAVAERALPPDTTAALEAAARTHHLTLNTVARGMWARLLGAHARTADVVFGATVAGRPASLAGVESIAGLFINTLPVRVRLDDRTPAAAWLQHLQRDHADLDQHANASLADIQRASGVPSRTALFDSIVVFENYPVDESIDPARAGLAVSRISVAEQTNYPLTLSVVPGERLLLRLSYDTSRYTPGAAQALLSELERRFEAFTGDPLARGEAFGAHRYDVAGLDAPAARALATALCLRYAGHEDLQCAVDDGAVARDGADTARAAVPDLAFTIDAAPGGVSVGVRSMSGRFDAAFLQRTEAHLATLAAAAAANPGRPLSGLPLLPVDERARLLDEFNNTARRWDLERTIAQRFEDAAAAHPDRVALTVPAHRRDDIHDDEVWTYGALNARANQLAHLIAREHGVGPDTRVGVLAERSADMVIALLAIAKAGGAYVPLDPEYPASLLRFMVEDVAPMVVLAQEAFAHLIAGTPAPVGVFERERDRVAREPEANLPSRVTGENLAYVIYTSGSTGRPKGAMNTHRAIANRLLWMQDAYGLTEHDRVLQKTPFSFDVSVWEFFWPLMTGARLVMAKPGGHRDSAYLASLVAHAGITTLHFVPSMLQVFIEEPGVARCESLARVIASGEAMTPGLVARYLARVPAPLHNLYGPTEAAVDVTAWPCTASDTTGLVPIGRPIANITLYILDQDLEPVAEGVTGELFLGGVGVGRGYLNRPELTAERFIPNPFGEGTLYRTGDLARYRAGGVVDFLGRIDHQVKIRGFRIELGEIESALLTLGGVREAAVVAREDRVGTKQLVAYIVAETGMPVTPAGVREALQRTLAAHMVPNAIVVLDALPRLPNGKIDRKGLPEPARSAPSPRVSIAPRDPMERRLARIWQDVLGRPHVGVADDFFELGGHSLSAIRLMGAIHAEFGRTLPLASLLQHTTIERMAVALGRAHDARDWRPLVEIRGGGSAAPLFLLPGAGGNVIYFHALARQLAAGRPIYALQATGLDGVTPPLTSVEAIAASHIDDMRRAWPSGPYYLAGHSFGGRVALEIARQLQHAGERVALLAVLDTAAPVFDPMPAHAAWTDAHWLERIAREIEAFFGVTLSVTLADLAPLPIDAQLALVIDQLQRAGAWAPGADPSQLAGYLQVYKTNTQMPFVSYDGGVSVPIALFKAREREQEVDAVPDSLTALMTEEAWGWNRFALGEVTVIEVPGAHLSMLAGPHAAVLAARLDEVIAAAEARPPVADTEMSL